MRNKIKKCIPTPILQILKELRFMWIVVLFHIFHRFPINKKRVVICNVWGFGDNAKYVTEELAKDKRDIQLIFVTNQPHNAHAPSNVLVVRTNSIKAIYYLATARVWLDNNRKERYILKRKGQYYIQTWHGGIALKKIERDYEEALGTAYVRNAKRDSAMTDLYISNSNFCTNLYRNSFWYKGEIKEYGSPRTDILLNPHKDNKLKICNQLGIPLEYKIAIYAPTYREGGSTKAYEMDFAKVLRELSIAYGGNWVIAVRLHPLVSALSGFITYNKSVINATGYRDIYELMAAAEVLITDYSNLMFEFSYRRKPVFLYAKDRKDYDKGRGFYFEYQKLPYAIAGTMEELLENIRNFQEEVYQQKVEFFLQQIDLYEKGNASQLVAYHIRNVIN
ncbi:MAG: CDP-glycerol glycerophosphotransferase family protein [Anaerocolumna sp.]